MSAALSPRVALVAGAAAVGDTVLWRHQGALRLTVVVKASFGFSTGGTMPPRAPEPIVRTEIHHRNNPARSVRVTSDLALFLPRADVVLVGHAWAPAGSVVEGMRVRLAVVRDRPLVDKSIAVRGNVKGDRVEPFDHVPLMFEHAFGGVGFEPNPLGTGVEGERAPNLYDPDDAQQVACFAPVARGFPERKRRVTSELRKALEAPIPEIPAGFDWTYYQAAPSDQRCEYLHGDERIVVEGMHPKHREIGTRLPDAHAAARLYGADDAGEAREIELVCDTLRIDADGLFCSLLWRGNVAVSEEQVRAGLCVVAAVTTGGKPYAWPEPSPREPASTSASDIVDVSAFAESIHQVEARVPVPVTVLDIATSTFDGRLPDPPLAAMPFRPAPPHPPPATGAPARPGSSPAVPPRKRGTGTLALEDGTTSAPPPLPFVRRTAPSSAPPPQAPAFVPQEHTAVAPFPAPATRPFAPAPRATPAQGPVAAPAPRHVRGHTPEGIALVHDGPLAFHAVPWGLTPGRACLTVIAKASCDLVPDEPALVRPEADALEHDVLVDGACVYPTDLALYKVRADVVLVGHAHAPGDGATRMRVRFAFGTAPFAFDRALAVFGDRVWRAGHPAVATDPEPFVRLPLGHERAFGGPKFDLNPVGRGHADALRRARREPVALPNLEDPERLLRSPAQVPEPACFGPVPVAWRDRAARAGQRAAVWPRLPEDFDWTRFQAAPAPQRLPFLCGDEPFAIEGCHPRHPLLAGSLPGRRARAFAARGERFEELALALDTVVIDTDRLRIALVWRAVVPVPDERAPGIDALYLVDEPLTAEPLSAAEAHARFSSSST